MLGVIVGVPCLEELSFRVKSRALSLRIHKDRNLSIQYEDSLKRISSILSEISRQSPPACKQVRYLPPGCGPIPTPPHTLDGGGDTALHYTPQHPLHGQPSPTTPEDHIGTGANHASWKDRHRHLSHQLEEKMSKFWCKNVFNNQKSNMVPLEQQNLNFPMKLKHKKMNLKLLYEDNGGS